MANDERRVCGFLEKEDRMKNSDSSNEYRGGKRGDDEDTTVPMKPHIAEKAYRRGDEDDI
jgi:hypothetical protein